MKQVAENNKGYLNMPDTSTVDKKVMKVVKVLLILGLFCLIVLVILITTALMPYDKNDNNKREFKVEAGWGSSTVIDKLAQEHFIKNPFFVKLYLKVNPVEGIKEGTYMISPSMDVSSILDILSSADSVENATVNIRLIEGKRYTEYAKQIADTFGFEYDDVINKGKDKDYLNKIIKEYWFVTDEILNEKINYPLEGYLFPDYYNIRKSASIEDVYKVMLDELGNKLTPYKDDITLSNKSVHSLLTLASMVELEAGTDKIELKDGTQCYEREAVSSVFNNRLNVGMKLGSDVTTYYAVDKVFQQSLTAADLNSCNGYNTRGNCVPALPVGPICSPSLSAITAAINPAKTSYMYFVADKNAKLYFAVDEAGHNNNIKYLQDHQLWSE